MIEPHFHKDYKISEKDLIPNDTTYSALPVSGLEGERAILWDGTTATFYRMVKGAWRQVGGVGDPLVIGVGSHGTPGSKSVTIGDSAVASGTDGVTVGYLSVASGVDSVALGRQSTASGQYGLAIGSYNVASGTGDVAIGNSATASGGGAFAFGTLADASYATSAALGSPAKATQSGEFAWGTGFSNPSFVLQNYDDSYASGINLGGIAASWVSNTHASRKARITLNVYDTAIREVLRGEASGSAPMIGFLGAAAIARPTVTGSRGGNAALASLLTQLANLGLVVDSST